MKTNDTALALVGRQRQGLWQRLQQAAGEEQLEEALICTEQLQQWGVVSEAVQAWTDQQDGAHPCYHVDAWFLRDLIRYLTPGPDEVITYVTGNRLTPRDRVLHRWCPVRHARQSSARAIADRQSCSDVLIEIEQRGLLLEAMAHSHPGRGAAATTPSEIDFNYIRAMEAAGAQVLGIIVTRDGYVRFYTLNQPFTVEMHGNGVTYVDESICRIDLA